MMTWQGWGLIGVFALGLVGLTVPLGHYMHQVFETDTPPGYRWIGKLERFLLRIAGVDGRSEHDWKTYALSVCTFSALGIGVSYLFLRGQAWMGVNPYHVAGMPAGLAFHTAVSFVTNTNLQLYAGESQVSYGAQMAALTWQNFTSASSGIGVALALGRGLCRPHPHKPACLGNFWVDMIRSLLYLFLPLGLILAVGLVSQGVVQSLAPYISLHGLEGHGQLIPLGPVASQEAIKLLGTNGGGFFNANSAHPFENPTPLSNVMHMLMMVAIPAGLTSTYGRMAGNPRQGWILWGAMGTLCMVAIVCGYAAEAQPSPRLHQMGAADQLGSLEGKEVRFGTAGSALYTALTTATGCGAVNASLGSLTPLGILVALVNIQLGEVVFGGVGSGLYGMLIFALLTVFLAGLMVGRTPEYLGKKIEPREVRLAILYILVFPLSVLSLSALTVMTGQAMGSVSQQGPHGFSEILYAYSSAVGNNGSVLAGLQMQTSWWQISLALAMLVGRFGMMIPVLAVAGSMARKKVLAPGLGTFPTDGGLFGVLLVAVVVIVGALTFLPTLCLGPIVAHFLGAVG